jgi:hypothetical protein
MSIEGIVFNLLAIDRVCFSRVMCATNAMVKCKLCNVILHTTKVLMCTHLRTNVSKQKACEFGLVSWSTISLGNVCT